MTMTKLNEFDKEEWRLVARRLRPDWSDEEFDRHWEDFQRDKERRAMH